ncbi:MAG: molecular chaperone DnaJ [Gemmatimonadetes bacterium]|nr:molecular chaperone DnaJ [Gemmatimonadota bacterium]
MADFYQTLGVSRQASADDIKRAYRKLAMEHHPDRNASPDAEARFREVTQAYEVLRDPEKRDLYDRYGEAGIRRGAGTGFGMGGFGFADAFDVFMREFGGGSPFEEIFSTRRRSGPRRGRDAKVRVRLTLGEAASGVKRTLRARLLDGCERCSGSGAEPGTSPVACETCGGRGEVRSVQSSLLGQFVSVHPCPRCGGEGRRIETPCAECRGQGRLQKEKRITIDVPPGVSSDDFLRLSGRGNAGPKGGPQGDLLVALEVEEDPRFERHGDDLVHNLAVTFSQAALGDQLTVPTIDGTAELEIPAGIQSGQALRLRGRGMPKLRAQGRGDQIVRVLVWTPARLSSEQRETMERLAELEDAAPEPDTKQPGFWERVKQAFSA